MPNLPLNLITENNIVQTKSKTNRWRTRAGRREPPQFCNETERHFILAPIQLCDINRNEATRSTEEQKQKQKKHNTTQKEQEH